MITCPSCGQENPEGARFCNACASPLTPETPGAREERKVVSILFADLVGFTSQSEQLDPEDVRAILSGYHERARFELERYGARWTTGEPHEVERALEFYRSVGATRYIREAEALLAASA